MTESSYLPPARLEQQRDKLIVELSAHFAHDNLDTAEFERRLDLAYQATTLAELDQLKTDLPALTAPAEIPETGVTLAPEHEVANRQTVFAFMGGTERKGVWTPARSIDAVAIMGGVELDFRDARFAPGVTQVNALALMGGIEILVPPGVRVESSGVGILGGFESLEQTEPLAPSAPVLRLTGLAIMGGVSVGQRYSGETAREAKQRLREERRRLRRGRDRLNPGS